MNENLKNLFWLLCGFLFIALIIPIILIISIQKEKENVKRD